MFSLFYHVEVYTAALLTSFKSTNPVGNFITYFVASLRTELVTNLRTGQPAAILDVLMTHKDERLQVGLHC